MSWRKGEEVQGHKVKQKGANVGETWQSGGEETKRGEVQRRREKEETGEVERRGEEEKKRGGERRRRGEVERGREKRSGG